LRLRNATTTELAGGTRKQNSLAVMWLNTAGWHFISGFPQTLVTEAINQASEPLAGSVRDYDPLLRRIGNARFCLLGEATHGTHEE